MRVPFLAGAIILAAMPALAAPVMAPCSQCAAWNAPQQPFRIYGNTYYVGVHGLAAILIVSDQGDVLIDGDLDSSPAQIAGHIKSLGFKMPEIKLILNSHAHTDHAGGLAQLQRLSGAAVAASPWSAALLKKGGVAADDPQYGTIGPIAAVANVRTIRDGETLHVGPIALTAHFTPGHTPGGTTWTWQSCEKTRCRNIVYADSLTAVSDDRYRYTDHPALLHGFDNSFAVLNGLPCDILLTPHPGFSNMFERLKARDNGKPDAFNDNNACHALAESSRDDLTKRLAREKAGK